MPKAHRAIPTPPCPEGADHSGRNLGIAFLLNLGFAIVEFIGGLLVNSVAILSDALHDLGDSLSLGLSWLLNRKSKQPGTHRYSFGFQRFSLLGALINGVVLVAGSAFIAVEAVERLMSPEESHALGMLGFAILGVAVNGYAALRLKSGKTLNERVVYWHLLEDAMGWVAVLLASIAIMLTGSKHIDPALSLLITLYILWQVARRLRETGLIFLQGVPPQHSLCEVEQRLLAVEGVESLHHTHLWSLDGDQHVFTSHVRLRNIQSLADLNRVRAQLQGVMEGFGFSHHTLELEMDHDRCRLEANEGADRL